MNLIVEYGLPRPNIRQIAGGVDIEILSEFSEKPQKKA